MTHHLAQINIGRVRGAMDSEIMHGFASRLIEINALADTAPGFVWRLQTDEGNATSIHVFDDEMLLINMSVWESPNPSLKLTRYGRLCKPGLWHMVHHHRPGLHSLTSRAA